MESLQALGDIGILYLMFMAGLELDLNVFNKVRNRAIEFGLTTFAMPFVLGLGSALFLDYDTAAAVLIGSLWASHTLVTYPTVRRFGLSGNPAVAMAVGATVITDTLALLVLALVVGAETGDESGLRLILELGLGMVALAAFCFAFLPWAMRLFFRGAGQERTLRYVALLVAMTGAAVLADEAGIEGIVGAFFAGLALNRLVPNGSPLMERAEFFGAVFFIPAFLVSVGLRVDPSVLASVDTIALAAVFLGAVVGGKLGAAWLTGRRYRFTNSETGTVFGLTVSQAAATLAAAIVGADAGILDAEVVNATILVVVVSLFIASVVTDRAAARVKPSDEEEERLGRVVLVPLAQPQGGDRLLRLARLIAEADSGLVVPLHVRLTEDATPAASERELVESLGQVVRASGLETELVIRLDRSLPAAIRNAAMERGGTLLLLDQGTQNPALDAVFGTQTDELVAMAPLPSVLTILADTEPRRIVTVTGPVPGGVVSVNARLALRLSKTLAVGGLSLLVGTPNLAAVREILGDVKDVTVEDPSGSGMKWAEAQALAGDIVVLPASTAALTFGGTSAKLIAKNGVSVAVVAGPYGSGVFATDLRLGLEAVSARTT